MASAREAHERAEQIRLGFQSTAVLYAKAVDAKDWTALGYRSVSAWAKGEFGPDRFSAERRKEIVAMLTAAGHTQRQIAAATNSSKGSVGRDQQELAARNAPSGAPGNARQQSARDREAAKRSRPRPASGGVQRHLSDVEIEEIITFDLTRGQITKRYGVGEHAAQLARTTAVAIARERQRADGGCVCSCGRCGPAGTHDCNRPACHRPRPPAPPAAPSLTMLRNQLREAAEEYLAQRDEVGMRLGTDRSKLTLFLDWLDSRTQDER